MGNDMVTGFRLSPQQKRLWELQRVCGTAGFRATATVELHGALDADRLERALARLVARHEILRTEFSLLDGMTILSLIHI